MVGAGRKILEKISPSRSINRGIMHDSLGDRMKNNYENTFRHSLPERMPVIIRLDGKAFHSYTKKLKRPFDLDFINAMNNIAIAACKEVQGAQIAYIQSDEISILLHNYKKLQSQSWLNNNIQKMASVSAGLASAEMTKESLKIFKEIRPAIFDSRVFVLPEAEVNNYFLWRQNDASRNSIQMIAQSMYSQKQLHRKGCNEMQEMIFQNGINWNNYPVNLKRGRCVKKQLITTSVETELIKTYDAFNGCAPIITQGAKKEQFRTEWVVDNDIPVFSADTNYIEQYLKTEE